MICQAVIRDRTWKGSSAGGQFSSLYWRSGGRVLRWPPSASPQAPDPHALGMTEAVFDYCAKADPKGAAKLRARLKRLVQGASRETLAKVRKSDEYRKARSSVDDFLAKVDERNASRVCSGPLAAGK